MDISKAFSAQSLSIYDFFTRESKLGLNIPQYQRIYSWDDKNIEQLIDDISKRLIESLEQQDNEIHFLGTIITIVNNNISKNTTDPDRKSALPSKVEDIIDGQQRLSTIALLACCLYQEIFDISSTLPDAAGYESLKEAARGYLENLKSIFSYDLHTRGNPTRKPIIIREGEDIWTKDDTKEFTYNSNISKFLAHFIRHISQDLSGFPWGEPKFRKENKGDLVIENLDVIRGSLDKLFDSNSNSDEFPSVETILDNIDQVDFWDFSRTEDYVAVKELEYSLKVDRLIRALAFSYFCLKRCCFTSIIPASEVRAFDMFQSLNATGTPLTAIETFKPLVINSVKKSGIDYSISEEKQHFDTVENLFKKIRTAATKDRRTSDYLILFDNAYAGHKLGKQFSRQRAKLIDRYKESQQIEGKSSQFTAKMACVADYFYRFIVPEAKSYPKIIEEFNRLDPDNKFSDLKTEACFSMLYLRDVKHTLAHSLIVRFYYEISISGGSPESVEKFYRSCKIVAAFFTLWKLAKQRSYPDSEYRSIIRNKFHWLMVETIDLKSFQVSLLEVLDKHEEFLDKSKFIEKAIEGLKYDTARLVCKFALFISAHNTVVDQSDGNEGLMQIGVQNTTVSYLDPRQWTSPELETIEHIAPENGSVSPQWDPLIYEDDAFHKIGNLTLLPRDVNSSASDKGWMEKYFYYQYMTEKYPEKRPEVIKEASRNGIELVEGTLKILENCKYSSHILPITKLGRYKQWSRDVIDKRSNRIAEIVYDRMYKWLSE